jgi:hypothetical protein
MYDSENICTMCVETVGRLGVVLGDHQCPVDQRGCPPDDELHRTIDERASHSVIPSKSTGGDGLYLRRFLAGL